MKPARPTYHLTSYYSAEFDGQAERLSMPDPSGAEFYAVIEVGPGGKELAARRDKAIELLLGAMRDGLLPGLRGVIVTPATLHQAKLTKPEIYGTPSTEQAA